MVSVSVCLIVFSIVVVIWFFILVEVMFCFLLYIIWGYSYWGG